MRTLAIALTAIVTAGLGSGSSSRSTPSSAPPTVVLLVRHGEKAAQPAQDPPLSPSGEARARALVAVAREAGVTAIITTQYERTRRTAAPTAAALGITPDVVQAGPMPQHAQAVADQVRKHLAGTVLVVGHSNTISGVVGALGAPRPPDLCDSEYDRLFVVVLGDTGPPRLIKSRFGAPSVEDAACAAMQAR